MNSRVARPREEIESWLRLSLTPDIGPRRAAELLRVFGSPGAIFSAPTSRLIEVPGLGRKLADALIDPAPAFAAAAEAERAEELGVRIVTLGDSDYPSLLRELPAPPPILYALGDLLPEDRMAIAVVGPRKPSHYAREMIQSMIPPLCARGITIVSGLAQGIDAEAHAAALQCDGRTIAVLGQGLGTAIFPTSNRDLARRIVQENRGAIVSVFPLDSGAEAGHFPHRNEIIAALSMGVLIPEASESSGALITARHAGEMGRTVMACPGDATRENARGSNRLLADGAVLIQRSDDVLAALAAELRGERRAMAEFKPAEREKADEDMSRREGSPQSPPPKRAPRSRDPLEALILDLLAPEHRTIDALLEGCLTAEFSQSAVVQKLLEMELSGRIRQLPGRIYQAALE